MNTVYLTRVDAKHNMARYYHMTLQPTLFGGWSLVREWGRIGRGGQVKMVACKSEDEASDIMALITKQKTKRGYIQLPH